METKKVKKALTRTKRITAIFAGLVGVLCLAGIAFLGNKYLFIREINFYGNRHLTNAELQLMTGLTLKRPLFSVTTRGIYRRLKTSPWIKDAIVRKDLSGNVTVYLTEALPVAVLQVDQNLFLIDSDGLRLEEIRPEPIYFLPMVKIDPSSYREAYYDAVELAKALNERKLTAHVGNIELTGTRPEDVTMQVDGVPIKVGAGDLPKKLEKLDFVRDELVKRNMSVEYIDLRFADKIVVKPLKPVAKEPESKSSPTVETVRKKAKQKDAKHKKTDKKVAGGKTKKHVG
ncbi:MAG: cell division protein FtsQ/DivIB [Dissulfurispiraceae bacterium]|jgi:cell division protein FtsQ